MSETPSKKAALNLLAIANVQPYVAKPTEEYMNEEQLHHFRTILKCWLKQLNEEMNRELVSMQDEPTNFADPADRATREEGFTLALRNQNREAILIKKIEKTLQKLDKQDFGYCEACGIEIGIPRLEARPTADLCIDCKTLAELREKQLLG